MRARNFLIVWATKTCPEELLSGVGHYGCYLQRRILVTKRHISCTGACKYSLLNSAQFQYPAWLLCTHGGFKKLGMFVFQQQPVFKCVISIKTRVSSRTVPVTVSHCSSFCSRKHLSVCKFTEIVTLLHRQFNCTRQIRPLSFSSKFRKLCI